MWCHGVLCALHRVMHILHCIVLHVA
jgi:hypothetical protein